MSIDIKARLKKKSSAPKTTLALEDINRDLIVSLFSVDVYGAEARDEEIHNIIIGGGVVIPNAKERLREEYDKIKDTLKRNEDGFMRDPNGYIVLEPI